MVDKKGLLCDSLLYLALLASIARLEGDYGGDNHLILPFDGFSSSVDDYGPTSMANFYQNRYGLGRDLDIPGHFSSAKHNVLLDETLRLYQDVNNLGRFNQRRRRFYNTDVIAYLVSGNDGMPNPFLRSEVADTPPSSSSVASAAVGVSPDPENQTLSDPLVLSPVSAHPFIVPLFFVNLA